jgi:hypothetical protein
MKIVLWESVPNDNSLRKSLPGLISQFCAVLSASPVYPWHCHAGTYCTLAYCWWCTAMTDASSMCPVIPACRDIAHWEITSTPSSPTPVPQHWDPTTLLIASWCQLEHRYKPYFFLRRSVKSSRFCPQREFGKTSCILCLPGGCGAHREWKGWVPGIKVQRSFARSSWSYMCGNHKTDDSTSFLLCHGKGF